MVNSDEFISERIRPDEGRNIRCQNALEAMREIVSDLNSWTPICHGTNAMFLPNIMEEGIIPRQCPETGECRPSTWEGNLSSMHDRVYLGVGSNDICEVAARELKQNRANPAFGSGRRIIFEIDPDFLDREKLTYDEDSRESGKNWGYNILESEKQEAIESCERWKNRYGEYQFGDRQKCIEKNFRFTYNRKFWNPLYLPGFLRKDGADSDRINSFGKMIEIGENCTKDDLEKENRLLPQWVKSIIGGLGSFAYRGTIPPEAIKKTLVFDENFHKWVEVPLEEVVREWRDTLLERVQESDTPLEKWKEIFPEFFTGV